MEGTQANPIDNQV